MIIFYGFRSYIRQFLGAILLLFRPSLPWGFAAGSGSILGCLLNRRRSRSRRSSSSSREQPGEKVAKIINHHFLWVSEVTLGSFFAHFDALPSFTTMGFAAGSGSQARHG